MAINLSTDTLPLLFALDACPVIGVSGRTIQFLNEAAQACFGDVPAGTAIRKLLPAHAALHQASAYFATARIKRMPYVVSVTSAPGLRLYRLEPVRPHGDRARLVMPDELFSAELGLASAFFSAHAAKADEPAVRYYAARLQRTSDQLRRWLNNTALLQMLHSGEGLPGARITDCTALLAAITEAAEPMLARSGQTLSLTLPETPCRVRMAPELFETLVLNLISNAMKASGSGGQIRITLMRETNTAHLTVTDTGEGFAKGVLTEVFRAYADGDLPRFSDHRAGFGLQVCLAVADELRGSVLLENSRSSGAAVHVFLPLHTSGKAVMQSPSKPRDPELKNRCRIGFSDALTDEDYLP